MEKIKFLIAISLFFNFLDAAIDPAFNTMNLPDLKKAIKEFYKQCQDLGATMPTPKTEGTALELKREATRLKKEVEKLKVANNGAASSHSSNLPSAPINNASDLHSPLHASAPIDTENQTNAIPSFVSPSA